LSDQYLRQLSVVIADASGSGLDFSQFRVTFSIRRGDYQTPNSVDLRIYNLSAETANKIQKEFSQVSIKGGYPGNVGQLFKGTIKQVRKGRIDQRDSYVDVTAADGDEAYNFAPISKTLASGTTPGGVYQALVTAMKAKGLTEGYKPNFPEDGSVRGQVFYGKARDSLRVFSNANDCAWSCQDGAITLIPLTSYIPGNVLVITPSTGLIGVPEQTQQGIHVRILLNPNVKIGQTIKLDQTDINKLRFSLDKNSVGSNLFAQTSIKTNGDGLYYVMVANHTGDTRGQEWYTDITCLAVDATVPSTEAVNALTVLDAGAIPRYSN
jgi:hypothetical protein